MFNDAFSCKIGFAFCGTFASSRKFSSLGGDGMTSVDSLLKCAENAIIAAGLTRRNVYAICGEYEISAPILPCDPADAAERVKCVISDANASEAADANAFANVCAIGGMLRFSLDEAALANSLPCLEEIFAIERACEGLLDALFCGDDGENGEANEASLVYARLCIMLHKTAHEDAAKLHKYAHPCECALPNDSSNSRELRWLAAQVFSGKRLAIKKLSRALKPQIADLSERPTAVLRICRAALGMILLNNDF